MASAKVTRAASEHRDESPRDSAAKTATWVKTKASSSFASALLKRSAAMLAQWDVKIPSVTAMCSSPMPRRAQLSTFTVIEVCRP